MLQEAVLFVYWFLSDSEEHAILFRPLLFRDTNSLIAKNFIGNCAVCMD